MAKNNPDPCRTKYGREFDPALRPVVAQRVAIDGSTYRNTTAFTHNVVKLTATKACFIDFGSGEVFTSSALKHYLPANSPALFNTEDNTKVAVVNAVSGETGYLYVSEMG